MSRPSIAGRRSAPAAGVAVPADRRFHRSALRQERRRLGRSFLRAGKWVLLTAVLVAAGVWAANIVLHARVLTVQDIRVRGNARLSAGDVQSLLQGIQGEHIFRVDFETYRRRVLDSPWVSSVHLSRVLPSTIDVRIVERTPMAIARVGQRLFLVDDTGVIIDAHGAEYQDLDLPIVDGLVSPAPGKAPTVEPRRVAVTAAFLRAIDTRADLRGRLSQIDVSNPHDVVVMFDHDAVWLHLGEAAFVERLNAYLELVPTLQERFGAIDYVDVRFGDRIFVRPRGRSDRVAVR